MRYLLYIAIPLIVYWTIGSSFTSLVTSNTNSLIEKRVMVNIDE
ncbi:hypothetical protein [Calothrix sp. FACHB-168]